MSEPAGISISSPPPLRLRAAMAAVSIALVAGCGGPSEDVRISLCKDIVAVHTAASPAYERAEATARGYEHAQVHLSYRTDGKRGTAACFYEHDAVEDTADLLANPLRAYATSPYRVIINGETLTRAALAQAIGRATLKIDFED
jgi:hypothetical protein